MGTAADAGRALLGGLLMALGTGWMLWATAVLRRVGARLAPPAAPAVFVDEGPFRYGRHPMYLGLTVALLGAALALGSPLLGVATGGLALLVDRVRIPAEEAQLRRQYGGWYSDYAADVRRWF